MDRLESLSYSPPMIGRMAGLHRNECSATSCRDLVVRDQFAFNDCAIIAGFNHAGYQPYGLVRRRWPPQRNLVVSSDRAGRMIGACALHQMIGSRPVAVTVEQRTDDAAAEHSGKRFLISFWLEFRDNFVALRKAANVQTLFVCRAATKTRVVWRVGFLDAFHHLSFKFQVPSFKATIALMVQ
jgi:hypothetical protein